MKYMKLMAAAMLALLPYMAQNAMAKNEQVAKAYVFGFAASFTDSTVFITDIQEMENVWINSKNKFLLQRDEYSNQLKNYLQGLKQKNRTCVVSYAMKRKKAEKKLLKIKKRYNSEHYHYDVRIVLPSEFSFKPVEPATVVEEQKPAAAPAPKGKGGKRPKKQKR